MPGCNVKPEQMFNLILGYNAHLWYYNSTTNWAAGYDNDGSGAVPADEVWVILAAHMKNVDRGCNFAIGVLSDGAELIGLMTGSTGGAGEAMAWSGMAVMQQGDTILFEVSGHTAGNDGNWGALGYKVKLTQ